MMDTPKLPLQLLAMLFILNLADAILTLQGLSRGLSEANPLFPIQNLWLKLTSPLIFAAVWLTSYNYTGKHGLLKFKRFLKALLCALLIFYLAVVAWNILILSLLR